MYLKDLFARDNYLKLCEYYFYLYAPTYKENWFQVAVLALVKPNSKYTCNVIDVSVIETSIRCD